MCDYDFGDSGRNHTKFYQVMRHTAVVITCTLILQGVPPTKFGRVKNVQNSARFLTTFDFDRKYLRNGSTYRKSEKYLINYISSPIGRPTSPINCISSRTWGAGRPYVGLCRIFRPPGTL